MSTIEFARDYGYSPHSPFWLVYAPGSAEFNEVVECQPSREAAEQSAARLALAFPGHEFHTLCVMTTISTSPVVVGTKFDPNRRPTEPLPEPAEFAEVEPAPQPALTPTEGI